VKVNIHAVQTGTVDIKTAHRVRKPGGLIRVFTDSSWTEWLPIYAWVIDHPEGIIVVDTGETSKIPTRITILGGILTIVVRFA
jgi:N-acyl homoserine lactone hydrolase